MGQVVDDTKKLLLVFVGVIMYLPTKRSIFQKNMTKNVEMK